MKELNTIMGLLDVLWEMCNEDPDKYAKALQKAGFSAREAYNELWDGIGLTPLEAVEAVEVVWDDLTREEITGLRDNWGDWREFEPRYMEA